jgi:hypothetical protein
MAPKAAQLAAKKRASKQKKRLIVLVFPMLGALVYAYMTLSSLGAKPHVAATPAAATTPGGSIPTPGSPDATVTPGIAAVPVSALLSFTALGRKDPFHDHGPKPGAGSESSGSGSSGSGSGKGSGSGGGSSSKQPSAPLTGAVISINGNKLALALGTQFGHAPGLSGVWLFRLVKVTRKTALIAVVGTRQHFMLHVRRPLTLEQNGGWKYTLILEPLGSAAPMTVQPTQPVIHDQQTP